MILIPLMNDKIDCDSRDEADDIAQAYRESGFTAEAQFNAERGGWYVIVGYES